MPESRTVASRPGLLYIRDSFLNAGQDSYSTPPSQDPDLFDSFENVMPALRGSLFKRWGYGLLSNPAQVYRRAYTYDNDTSNVRKLILTAVGRADWTTEGGATPTNIYSPVGTLAPRVSSSRDYAYFLTDNSSDYKKWDGTTLTKWGITSPAVAVGLGATIAGAVTLTRGRKYYQVFYNGTSQHFSGLSPVSASTGPLTSKQIPLSLASSADAQVTRVYILATGDSGDETTLYYLTDVANGVLSYNDNTPEATLLAANVYLQVNIDGLDVGVADNTPPPVGALLLKHLGRLWIAKENFLYFSKSQDELVTSTGVIAGRYEESWPAANFLDISEGAETVKALFSDGMSLFIGTERHIRRLDGSSILDFSKPEVVFNDVGVLSQEVLSQVYAEGNPAGAMWLTPDFKVVMSDFTTFKDVGKPVQDILNTINTAQLAKCHATNLSAKGFDLYALAIPTGSNTECDTVLVFNLKNMQWAVWRLTDTPTAMVYFVNTSGVPKWFFGAATGKLYQLDSSFTQDRTSDTPVSFTSTIRTSWLNLSDPTARKHLNDIEVATGDSALSVSVDGASTNAEFTTPTSVVSSTVLSASFLGELRIPLAGKTTKDRFYRLKFVSTANTTNSILDYFKLSVIPVHQI